MNSLPLLCCFDCSTVGHERQALQLRLNGADKFAPELWAVRFIRNNYKITIDKKDVLCYHIDGRKNDRLR